jgi:hypothetical protein
MKNEPSAITGIDHLVVVVNQLDQAQATWNQLGFTTTPRGHHSVGSSNHCMMLGNDYLELLHMPPHLTGGMSPMRSFYIDYLKAGDGLAGVALASDNAEGAVPHLREAGFEPDLPRALAREVNDHGRKGTARFTLLHTAPATTPGGLVFICQHHTRDFVWMPEYRRHANGAQGIAALSLVGDHAGTVSTAANTYGKLFGRWPERIDEGLLVRCGAAADAATMSFSTRQAMQARLPGVALPQTARPYPTFAVLWVRVASREATAKYLKQAGVPFAKMIDGSLAVGADVANGVAVVFG